MMKKFLLVFIFLLWPLAGYSAKPVELYFFYADSCPHCHKEALFLDQLADDYGNKLEIHRLEIGEPDNVSLLLTMAQELKVSVSGVPFTVIGLEYFIGYYNDETTGQEIKGAIDNLLQTDSNNVTWPVKPLGQPEPNGASEKVLEQTTASSDQLVSDEQIDIPVLGQINPRDFSLPILSVVLGFLDGFNPCAMWALIFLISLLLGMANKKRMWILGSTFIVTSAFVYFMFMAAWLNIFLFLGLVLWIRIAIGLLALGGGAYNIREFFKNKAGTCKLDGQAQKKRVFDKLKTITEQPSFILALFGIVLLAIAVNMVELICSAGLPAVYTQVLALNDLSTLQHYSYILLYIFFFMLDDLLVFILAMVTLRLTGLSTKYSRYSSLVGGVLMVVIGLLLLFRYEILTFS
ncbi:MAG: hypothetical protein A2406_03540 [Candidatus Komeilibacteria bacterium RIFOXYC1_FULL_37_11]|uniref:Thioredoxin domain-containing protein n=1 Tax=Candidatus Komeilibacteria bacterium RIFOXYC1_FULL_37_11 TaxID=1798555 RepID=A0A1G2C040_9BACT|nr:MAG: hypothetical protein A2406_03540 [Candidatus Komeilibacteria bacterium RIFOXYC1_FULL_37_11]OGY95171.1 MAG: hypothetical protein A2611_00480 [Candidatus Komeilibacteria bacterium RIFOXYD1_FULL_37_29]